MKINKKLKVVLAWLIVISITLSTGINVWAEMPIEDSLLMQSEELVSNREKAQTEPVIEPESESETQLQTEAPAETEQTVTETEITAETEMLTESVTEEENEDAETEETETETAGEEKSKRRAVSRSNTTELGINYTTVNNEPMDLENWDYITDYNYLTNLTIIPADTETKKKITFTAPGGMRFHEPSVIPGSIETLSFNEDYSEVTIVMRNAQATDTIVLGFLTTVLGSGTDGSQNGVAQYVGEQIVSVGKEEAERPKFGAVAKLYEDNDETVSETTLLTPAYYETEDVFDGLFYYKPSYGGTNLTLNGRVSEIRITKDGKIGAESIWSQGDVYSGLYFYLDSRVTHEPYWDLYVKVLLPEGITVGPACEVPVVEADGQRYLLFNKENYAPNNGAESRMHNALADMVTPKFGGDIPNPAPEPDIADYQKGKNVFGANLDLQIAEGEILTPNKEYKLKVMIGFTNDNGPKEQTDKEITLITDNFEKVDQYNINYMKGNRYLDRMESDFDLPQGYTGNAYTEYQQYFYLQDSGGTVNYNNPHIGGTLTILPGDGYELYEGMMEWATDAIYYMSGDDLAGAGRTAVKDGSKFTFSDAADSGRIVKIVFSFADGLYLDHQGLAKCSFGFRTQENLNDNTQAEGVYKTSMTVTLRDAYDVNPGLDGCSEYNNQWYDPRIENGEHTKILDVYLRKPKDTLIVQTYGSAHNGNVESDQVFLDGKSGEAIRSGAYIAFGHKGSTGEKDNRGEWINYHDYQMQIAGSRALEMLSGNIILNKYMAYTNARFDYKTNKTSGTVQVGNSGTAYIIGSGETKTVTIPLAEGEYITELSFAADEFMPLTTVYDQGGPENYGYYWSIKGSGARIEFKVRDSREFISDGTPVAHYDKDDSMNTAYPFDVKYSADEVADEKDSITKPELPVRFYRYLQAIIYVEESMPIVKTGTTLSQGSKFTMQIETPIRVAVPGVNYFSTIPSRNYQLWLEVTPGFIYAGNDPNVRQVRKDGKTYLIMGEQTGLDVSKQKLYSLEMEALPFIQPGQHYPFTNGWANLTDTLDPAVAEETPYWMMEFQTRSANPEADLIVNDVDDINKNGSTDETLMKINNNPVTVTTAIVSGAQIFAGVGNGYNKEGVKFREADLDRLTGIITFGGSTAELKQYELNFPLPDKGDEIIYEDEDGNSQSVTAEFSMKLKGPVKPMFDAALAGAQIEYQLNGMYVAEDAVGDEWGKVTNVRVQIPKIEGGNSGYGIEYELQIPEDNLSLRQSTSLVAEYQFEDVTAAGGITKGKTNSANYTFLTERIKGYVFIDKDRDGRFNNEDTPVKAGTKVELLMADGNDELITTVTDADGYYEFKDPVLAVGEYRIRYEMISPYGFTKYQSGNDGNHAQPTGMTDVVQVTEESENIINAGYAEAILPKTLTKKTWDGKKFVNDFITSSVPDEMLYQISVQFPSDMNGYTAVEVQDQLPDELQLRAGADTVKARIGTEEISGQISYADGKVSFLLADSYLSTQKKLDELAGKILTIEVQTEFKDSVTDYPESMTNEAVFILNNDQKLNADEENKFRGKIEGYLFFDKNRNGKFDLQDEKIGTGQIVTLYAEDAEGQYTKTGKTAEVEADGSYYFDLLEAGNYVIKFPELSPKGFTVKTDSANGNHVNQSGQTDILAAVTGTTTKANAGYREIVIPTEFSKQIWDAVAQEYKNELYVKDLEQELRYQIAVTIPEDVMGYYSVKISDILPEALTLSGTEDDIMVKADGVQLQLGTKTIQDQTITYQFPDGFDYETIAGAKITMELSARLNKAAFPDPPVIKNTAKILINDGKVLKPESPQVKMVYTVTFDENGGDTKADPQQKEVAAPAVTVGTLPADPARKGYLFKGWNTKDTGDGLEFGSDYKVTGDMTVYAKWEPITYTIRYDVTANKGIGQIDDQIMSYDQSRNLYRFEESGCEPPAGYRFAGWSTKQQDSTVEYSDGQEVINLSEENKGVIVLYAIYTEKENVDIHYHSEDILYGSVSTAIESLRPVSEEAKGSTAKPEPGYMFSKWTDDSNGQTISYAGNFVPAKIGTLNRAASYTAHFTAREEIGGNGLIGANHFSYALKDGNGKTMPQISAEKAKTLSDAFVSGYVEGSSPLREQSIKNAAVDVKELKAVNEAIMAGIKGEFELTFYTEDYDQSAGIGDKTTIIVTLTGNADDQDPTIGATGFSYAVKHSNNTENVTLTENPAKVFAHVWARKSDGSRYDLSDVKADEEQLKTINAAKHQWFVYGENYTGDKVFPLTFTNPEGGKVVISVTLFSKQSVWEEKSGSIAANDFVYDIAGGVIDENMAKQLAAATWKDQYGNELAVSEIEVNEEEIAVINQAIINGQLTTYLLSFTAPGGLNITINVRLIGSRPVFGGELYKTDEADSGLTGATFKLVDAAGNQTWLMSGTDGKVRLELPVGEYTLTETKAPEGYFLNDAEIKFTITDDYQLKLSKKSPAHVSLKDKGLVLKVINERDPSYGYLNEDESGSNTEESSSESHETKNYSSSETNNSSVKKVITNRYQQTVVRTSSGKPKTGDATDIIWYIIASVAAVITIVVTRRRKKQS